jgi:hypothetical protein
VTPKMKTVVNIFIQFHQVENGVPGKLVKEIYVPAALEAEQTGFDPEKIEWYTVGYPLMPGDYLASIAVCSQDLKKIGVQYLEFKLPDPKSYTSTIDTTPIFFMKEYKQVQAPEQKPELHKGFFAYSVIQVAPSLDNVFVVGQVLDLFTYIFGCQPKSGSTYDIEVVFEVVQGDKAAIKFAPGSFDSPLVSLPLQLKQTLQSKQGSPRPARRRLHLHHEDQGQGFRQHRREAGRHHHQVSPPVPMLIQPCPPSGGRGFFYPRTATMRRALPMSSAWRTTSR